MTPSSPAAIRSCSCRRPGTNRRQYATWSGTPAAAATAADACAAAAVSPHGFSHKMGSPRAATSAMIAPCWSVGAAMSTPSSAVRSSISATLWWTATPGAATASRAAGDISAMAVTFTTSEPARARRWVRPMRPAPIRPIPNGAMVTAVASRYCAPLTVLLLQCLLQAARGQELAVVPLLGRRAREPLGAARQDVLFDHQPAAERDPAQALQHGVGVQVAAAQRAERLPGPDLGHRRLVRDDLGHDRQPGVLEVHVVDPVAEVAEHGHRVAAAEQHVPGLQAQPDVRHLEHPLDLPRRLDVSAGLRVEGRLVAPVTAAVDHPGQAGREPAPRVGVEPERGVPDRTPGPVPPRLAASLRERRPR